MYSQIDSELLCASCEHGQVIESAQGSTMVVCSSNDQKMLIPFVVTKCTAHRKKELTRIYDTAQTVKFEDGHVWTRNDWGRWQQYGVPEPRVTLRQWFNQWWDR